MYNHYPAFSIFILYTCSSDKKKKFYFFIAKLMYETVGLVYNLYFMVHAGRTTKKRKISFGNLRAGCFYFWFWLQQGLVAMETDAH